jgi:hypothetical protein
MSSAELSPSTELPITLPADDSPPSQLAEELVSTVVLRASASAVIGTGSMGAGGFAGATVNPVLDR